MGILPLLGIVAFLLLASAFEWLAIDVVALVCLGALLVFGLVTPEQAISGFSNSAVIIVLMMMILSDALVQSGLIAKIGHRITNISGSAHWRVLATLLVGCGLISAFINNTATIALFIPLALQLAKHFRLSPSKIMLPLNYAVVIGGTCTLIGTSTNILVSSLAVQHNLPALKMFEFVPLGLLFLVLGAGYGLLLVKLLPSRGTVSSLTRRYQLASYLTELKVPNTSRLAGRTVVEEQISDRLELNVLEILRGKQKISIDIRNTVLQEGDVLIVRGSVEDIVSFREQYGLLLLADTKLADSDLADENNILAEVQLSPASTLEGLSLKEIDFRRRYGCFVLALNRTGEVIREKLASIPLQRWDTLLVFGSRARVEALHTLVDFVPLQEVDVRLRLARRWWLAALTLVAVVATAAGSDTSLLEASILGVVFLLASRALKIQQAYRSINWTVIFLLAATIPLGIAMESTGLSKALGTWVAEQGSRAGPAMALSLTYFVTMVLTELLSNASTAVLMVPVALTTAASLGVDPKPFIMAVTYAASLGFMTPIGYQTNAMVFGPGNYRYADYIRAGLPLNLLFWLLSSLLIPRLWPFAPG